MVLNKKEIAISLHKMGFNVLTQIITEKNGEKKKQPYIPISEQPYKWDYLKKTRLTLEQLTQAIDKIELEKKEYFLGFIPGKITEGMYQGKYSFGIDFDDPKNIEHLGITKEKCKEVGVWFEPSYSKGHHIYGVTSTPMKYNKQHGIGIELFSDDTFYIGVYCNFDDGFYPLSDTKILEVYNGWCLRLSEIKGVPLVKTHKDIKDLKKGVAYPGRNNSAFKVACDYSNRGLSKIETIELMKKWNLRNTPPMGITELNNCIDSVYKRDTEKKYLLDTFDVLERNKDDMITGINALKLGKLILHGDEKYYLVTKDNQEIFSYNGSYYDPCGDALIKERVQYYLEGIDEIKGMIHYKKEVTEYIRNHAYVEREQLNPPINLINVKNGVYNIETGELTPHTPEDYFLQETPIIYNPDAKINTIQKFFEDTLNQEDINVIQEFFGDCLLREYRYKKALICVGETDTGKSQLLSLLGKFLGGNNISSVPLDKLCYDRFSTIELYSKNANIRSEMSVKTIREVDTFLMLTGGDIVGAERKFQQRFNFRNYAKLIFSCNKIPESEFKNDAYYNRWIPIEFTNQVPKEEQIPNFFDVISSDEELSGLFNWAIIGLKRLMDNNRYSDHRSIDSIKEFMEKGVNPILDFVNTYIEREENGEISKDDMYRCYCEFCKSFGFPTKDSNVFSRKFKPLAPLGMEEGETNIGKHKRVWRGVKCTWVKGVPQEKLEC